MQGFDLLIHGAEVIDGSGAPAFRADVGIIGDRIAVVGRDGEAAPRAASTVLDASGLCVCPGFVDIHSHSDFTLLVNPAAESKLHQGVTTEVNGQCGFTPFPVRDADRERLDALCPFITPRPEWTWCNTAGYLEALAAARPRLRPLQMVGHSALRAWVMGFDNRPASKEETAAMAAVGAEALDQGAIGLSFGLAYPLGKFAALDEVEALAQMAAQHNAHISVHLRNEGAELFESLEEIIALARRVSDQAPLRLQIDHLKAAGRRWWGKAGRALEIIEAAREEGVDVAFDVYPYTAGSRHLTGSLPAWVHDGGNEAVMARLQDPECRKRLRREHEAWQRAEAEHSPFELDLEQIVVTDVATEGNRELVGKTLVQVGQLRGQDPLEATLDLIVEERGHCSVVLFCMSDQDMRQCLRHPLGCIGTDGLVFAPYGPLSRGKPHPRSYGTFPRAIGRYARDEGLMSVEEAIRKSTSLPASRLGLKDRGLVREGLLADLVVFDRERLLDTATFEDPHRYPEGVVAVIVGGKLHAMDEER